MSPPTIKASTPPPLVRDWARDVVYLVQMPRAGCIPSLSADALSLETWLRMADISYRNVDNQFHLASHGHTPFVELGGRQLAGGSRAIMGQLASHFRVPMSEHERLMSEFERAEASAWLALVEDRLGWLCLCLRSWDNAFFADLRLGIGAHLLGDGDMFGKFALFRFKQFALRTWRTETRNRCRSQGVGLLPRDELLLLVEADLRALSTFLAEKRFLLGERPSSLDASAFGKLAQLHFCPSHPHVKSLLASSCHNLVAYLERMRTRFWPDWAQATGSRLTVSLDNVGWRRHRTKLADGLGEEEEEEGGKPNWAFRADV